MVENLLPLCLFLALPRPAAAQSPELARSASGVLFDGSQIGISAGLSSAEAPGQAAVKEPEIITLSQLAGRLSQDPKALQALADAIRDKAGKYGRGWPALGDLAPAEKQKLIGAIQSADKSFLDSFPTMSPAQLKAFIVLYGRKQGPLPPEPPYPTEERLALPGAPQEASDGAFLTDWGHGLYHGDLTMRGLDAAYGDNDRLATVLNRLAMNEPGKPAVYALRVGRRRFTGVKDFLEALLAGGHSVSAKDMRFFANFGGIWFKQNQEWVSVVTPLFVDTGLTLPSGRKLIVPVTHSHLQLDIRGPRVNASMIYYLGVGGASMFYPLATADKPWVGGRVAQAWTGARAVELAERAATSRRELARKVALHGLPLGGYGPLGACNDIQAMITQTPIYPQTRDPRYYNDGMTIDGWAQSQPVDGGSPPDLRRVYDSLPVQDPDEVKVPQVREVVRELKAAVEPP